MKTWDSKMSKIKAWIFLDTFGNMRAPRPKRIFFPDKHMHKAAASITRRPGKHSGTPAALSTPSRWVFVIFDFSETSSKNQYLEAESKKSAATIFLYNSLLEWPAGTRPAEDLWQYFLTLNSVEFGTLKSLKLTAGSAHFAFDLVLHLTRFRYQIFEMARRHGF